MHLRNGAEALCSATDHIGGVGGPAPGVIGIGGGPPGMPIGPLGVVRVVSPAGELAERGADAILTTKYLGLAVSVLRVTLSGSIFSTLASRSERTSPGWTICDCPLDSIIA